MGGGDRRFVCESMGQTMLMGFWESTSGVRNIYLLASHNNAQPRPDGTTCLLLTAQGKRSALDCRLERRAQGTHPHNRELRRPKPGIYRVFLHSL